MASLDEESTLLRGNAAPKYRTNLIVGALAAASFMFGVGVATTLDRNAARATRLDVYGQVDAGVEIAGKVTDQAGTYINDPSKIPTEDIVDTVKPIVEDVLDNFDKDDVPSWVDPIIKTVNGIVGWINGLLSGNGGEPGSDDDDETNAKVLCPGNDSGFEQEYCDCMGDCTDPERSAWCACSEAQLCCAIPATPAAMGDDATTGDDTPPADDTTGDDMSGMSAGDDTAVTNSTM
jgi:hypothetical protein